MERHTSSINTNSSVQLQSAIQKASTWTSTLMVSSTHWIVSQQGQLCVNCASDTNSSTNTQTNMVDLIQCIYPRVQSLSEQGMLQCLYQYPSKTAFCLESFVGDDKETIDKLTTYLKDSARLDGTELIYQHQSLKAHHKVIRFSCKFGKTQKACHHYESFFSDGKMQMNNTILAREHRAHSSKNNSSSSKNKLSLLPGKQEEKKQW